MQEFLKVKDVAKKMNMDSDQVYQWIHEGKIPAIKAGKRFVRIPRKEFEKVLEQWRIKPKKEGKDESN